MNLTSTMVSSGLKNEPTFNRLQSEPVLQVSGATITMTSLELVDFINEERKARADSVGAKFPSSGFAKLEHADFLKKVPLVLGQDHAGKFSETVYRVNPSGGRPIPSPGYRFPKREACLMAMSYSYELQAKVFDRMTELEEEQQQKPQLTGKQPTKVRKVYGLQWYDCPARPIDEDFRKVEMLAQFADLSQADKLIALAMTVVQHDEYFASVILAVKNRVTEPDGIKLQLA